MYLPIPYCTLYNDISNTNVYKVATSQQKLAAAAANSHICLTRARVLNLKSFQNVSSKVKVELIHDKTFPPPHILTTYFETSRINITFQVK